MRTEYTERWKEAITSTFAGMRLPLVSAFAEGTGMRISPRDEREKEGEAIARSEGSTPGIGSIARTRTCALARALVCARAAATRVCARDPFHRVRELCA